MANNLLTMSYITNEALVVLENELVIANRVERQYSNEFAQTGAKVGNTVNIRRPPRYIGTYGPPLNVEDSNETYLPVVLNYQFHVDVQFTTQDLALSMDMFKKRILRVKALGGVVLIGIPLCPLILHMLNRQLGRFLGVGLGKPILQVSLELRDLLIGGIKLRYEGLNDVLG